MSAPRPARVLSGAHNFRDLGGLSTLDGRRTASGAIFRSAALAELSPDDVRVLGEELSVASVIDLRAAIETGGGHPDWAEATRLEFVNLPLTDDWDDWDAHESAERNLLTQRYLSYVDAASDKIVAALRLVAKNAGRRPTLIHCAVGKDRTGVVVGILLSLLGVRRDEIVADYCRTAENLEPILSRLAEDPVYRERILTNPAEIYLAEERTIADFMTDLDERYGGVEAWASEKGLAASELDRMRRHLLVTQGQREGKT